jgi:hypothetical protein
MTFETAVEIPVVHIEKTGRKMLKARLKSPIPSPPIIFVSGTLKKTPKNFEMIAEIIRISEPVRRFCFFI